MEKTKTDLVKEISNLKVKLHKLEEEMDTLKIKAQSSEGGLMILEGDVSEIEANVSDNRIAIDHNSDKLDVLEQELNDIHENLGELKIIGKVLKHYFIMRTHNCIWPI